MTNGHDLNECYEDKLVSGYTLECPVFRVTIYPTELPKLFSSLLYYGWLKKPV